MLGIISHLILGIISGIISQLIVTCIVHRLMLSRLDALLRVTVHCRCVLLLMHGSYMWLTLAVVASEYQ